MVIKKGEYTMKKILGIKVSKETVDMINESGFIAVAIILLSLIAKMWLVQVAHPTQTGRRFYKIGYNEWLSGTNYSLFLAYRSDCVGMLEHL